MKKKLAIIAGVLFLIAGIAGFAGLYATLPMYSATLAVAGALFIMFSITRRRGIIEPRAPGRDLRDLDAI
jgi:arginine exporter protein ArgO